MTKVMSVPGKVPSFCILLSSRYIQGKTTKTQQICPQVNPNWSYKKQRRKKTQKFIIGIANRKYVKEEEENPSSIKNAQSPERLKIKTLLVDHLSPDPIKKTRKQQKI